MHLPGDFLPPAAETERQIKMNDIRPPEGLIIRLVHRTGKLHSLRFHQPVKDRQAEFGYAHLVKTHFTDRGGRLAAGQDRHGMAPPAKLFRKPAGGHGGAVIAAVKLVDYQNDLHPAASLSILRAGEPSIISVISARIISRSCSPSSRRSPTPFTTTRT